MYFIKITNPDSSVQYIPENFGHGVHEFTNDIEKAELYETLERAKNMKKAFFNPSYFWESERKHAEKTRLKYKSHKIEIIREDKNIMYYIKHDDDTTDARFTVTKEFCGYEKPKFVFRFCDDFISSHERQSEAIESAQIFKIKHLITRADLWNRDSDMGKLARAYCEAALWAEELESDHDLDSFHITAINESIMTCAVFYHKFKDTINGLKDYDFDQAGHDLWLTRNRHGAGFWDRGIGESGEKMTEYAHKIGGSSLFQNDDGFLYFE